MADKFISMRNLQFLLYEHLDIVALTKYPYFADHSRETFDMVLETAMRMSREISSERWRMFFSRRIFLAVVMRSSLVMVIRSFFIFFLTSISLPPRLQF